MALIKTIDLADLRLNPTNPRIPPQEGQREAVAAVFRDGRSKQLRLMRDIAQHGLSPIDPLLVVQIDRTSYRTLEGNRRLAGLKVMDNPRLVDDDKLQAACDKIAKNARVRVTSVQCAVLKSDDEARHWLELRHTGENRGAGVVPWSPEQQHRFLARVGTDVHAGSAFADAVQNAFTGDASVLQDLAKVRTDKITTLGRLVRDPDFRSEFGMLLKQDGLRWHYPTDQLAPAIRKILQDLAGSLTVSDIKSKLQRAAYLGGLPKPDAATYKHQASVLKPVKAAPSKTAAKKTREQPPSKYLFTTVSLNQVSARTQAIAGELRHLDVNKFPNACGVLLRVILEISVDDFLVKKKIKLAQELKDKIRRALREIDPTDKDPRFQAIRVGLTDATSQMAARTMHAFVHNQHYHPTPTELRQIAANYGPFIAALDSSLP